MTKSQSINVQYRYINIIHDKSFCCVGSSNFLGRQKLKIEVFIKSLVSRE